MSTVASPGLGARAPTRTADLTPVTVETLSSADVVDVVSEWDACASVGAGNPFTQSPWFSTAVYSQAAARSDLCLLVGRDAAGTVQAVAPMCLSRPRLPLLGLRILSPVALHRLETSAIVVGEGSRSAASGRVVEHLLTAPSPAWDVLHLPAIDPTSVLFASLLDGAARHGLPVLTGVPAANPVLTPTAGGAPSRARVRFRRNVRRARRAVRQSGRALVCREISWQWHEHAEAVAAIGDERRRKRSRTDPAGLGEPQVLRVLDLLLGRLDRYFRAHVFAAFVDGALAAYLVCFRTGSEVVFWRSGTAERFRSLPVALLLWDHCLQEIAQWNGVTRINLGRRGDRYRLGSSATSYAVCELAIVRATGLRRRRALARFGRLARGGAAVG